MDSRTSQTSYNEGIAMASMVLTAAKFPIEIVLYIVKLVQIPKPQKIDVGYFCLKRCVVFYLCNECEKYNCSCNNDTLSGLCNECYVSHDIDIEVDTSSLDGEVPFTPNEEYDDSYMPQSFIYSGGHLSVKW